MPKAPPTPPLPLNGLFPVAKPSGPASMRIIDAMTPLIVESRLFRDPNAELRPKERNKRKKNATHMGIKIGQGGTLDPLADGVLVIGVNRGTKHLNRFLLCSKEYEAIGLLGAATTSYDSDASVLSTGNFDNVKREDVEKALEQFRGKIKQTPPIFSALKMDGKPLYEYARESKPLPRPIPVRECEVSIDLVDFTPAQVVEGDGGHTYEWPKERLDAEQKDVFSKLNKLVHEAGGEGATAEPEVDLDAPDFPEVSAKTGLRPPTFTVRMTVSSGTYVRSIVHDIGLALGCGAHVVKLTRTRQGEFVLHGDEEELARLDAERAAAEENAATAIEDEEAAMNAEAGPSGAAAAAFDEEAAMNDDTADATTALNAAAAAAPNAAAALRVAHTPGPTTPCIPWDVFERAIAERDETLKREAAEKEEAIGAGMAPDELRRQFGPDAIAAKRAQGDLKEWETEVLRRFHSVPVPVVRDSKSRRDGVYFR